MNWTREVDDNGNTVWTAPGPYRDTDASWRLEQRLIDDRIVWAAKHTKELQDTDHGDYWPTVEEAKAETELAHQHILDDAEIEDEDEGEEWK